MGEATPPKHRAEGASHRLQRALAASRKVVPRTWGKWLEMLTGNYRAPG